MVGGSVESGNRTAPFHLTGFSLPCCSWLSGGDVTAKNIWLAENVLEILTEQRYGWSGGTGEGWYSLKRAAARHEARESTPHLPAKGCCPAYCKRGRFQGSVCGDSLRGSVLMGFPAQKTSAFPYCVTKRIFKPWYEFLVLGALLLQAVCGRVS